MTIFSDTSLVVSLPVAELTNVELPGSVMEAGQAMHLPVSRTLTCALELVESHCRRHGIKTIYVVRPEVFTHGMSARWLRDRLGGVREHLCITDASAVKHIDGCNTHIFLYRLAYYDSYASFFRLTLRAPELLHKVSSQVNTAFGWMASAKRVQPPTLYLDAMDVSDSPPPVLYPFRFSPHMFERTAQEILEAKASLGSDEMMSADVSYIPLTETSLHDAAFTNSLSRHLLKAFFNPQELLLLRLPSERHGETLAVRVARVLEALASSRFVLPRSAPHNIFFVSSDLTTLTDFSNHSIVLHESFEFWRHSSSFYELASSIRVEAAATNAPSPEFLPLDVTPIYGDRASRVWLSKDGLPQQPEWRTA